MTTSPSPVPVSPSRAPLRLRLGSSAAGTHIDGAWWPQSRDLQTEAADLVDNFPATAGDIDRLLFSRPDWDNPAVDRHGLSRIPARRGPVKVGSFPSDDTHLMVLTMASGQRLRLLVIPCEVDADEGDRQLMSVGDHGAHDVEDSTWQRWDDEGPGS